ncbi:hypothetical protein C7R95_24520, partial [Enterobacter hormaechei]
TFPAGQPVVAFVHCTVEVEITQTISGNTITIDFLRPNATGTAYVYFFSIFPQTKPDYGLAVWDASGGQPQPYSAIYKSMAKLEGSNTRIFARPQTTPGGNLQNVTYSNLSNMIMDINSANYD